MKTAMQELIDRLDKTEKQLDKENNLIMSCALFAAKNMAIEALAKEKEQIIDAWNKRGSTIVPRYFLEENINGEEYYNQTYNHLHIVTDGNVGLSNPSETTNNKITISETKRSIEGIGLNNQNK